MCEEVWLPAVWAGCDKYFPPHGHTNWKDIVASTNSGRKVAKYHNALTLQQIEQIEMAFRHPDDLLYEDYPVRFYAYQCDRIIGASCGEETDLVLIKRHQAGAVHGYPITEREQAEWLREAEKRGQR